jgi:hypothetical protein
MYQLINVSTVEQLAEYQDFKGIRLLSQDDYKISSPDAHWVLLRGEATIAAACSLWWRSVPPVTTVPDQTLGFIGHYAADGDASAQALLSHACNELRQHGCTQAIAPINGSTWQSYRLICDQGQEPGFFLEMDHPDDYPQQFQDQGFSILATYRSTLTHDLLQCEPRLEQVEQRLIKQGVKIRSLDLQQLEQLSSQLPVHTYSQVSISSTVSSNQALSQPGVSSDGRTGSTVSRIYLRDSRSMPGSER